MGNVIQKPKVYQYAQPSKVESKRYESGIGKTLLSSGANLATGTIGSIIGAEISDRYNKKAEERMDKRNRQLILDTPSLTTQGRRRAGLNPYGDPILPGMSSQSSTDTSDVAPNSFYEAQQMSLQERIAVRQLENETLVAKSQANLNDANADRARGLEGRDSEMFDIRKEMEQTQLFSAKEVLRINRIDAEIKEATQDTEIRYSAERLNKVIADVDYVNAMRDKAISDLGVNSALVEYYDSMSNKLSAEIAYLSVQKVYKQAELLAYQGYWDEDSDTFVPGIWDTIIQANIWSSKQANAVVQQFELLKNQLSEKQQAEIDSLVASAEATIKNANTNAKRADTEKTLGWAKIVVGVLAIGAGLLTGGVGGAVVATAGAGVAGSGSSSVY